MSVWTDPIIIPPMTIVYFISGFLLNKILEKASGRKFANHFEELDYLSDKGVEYGVKHGKKIKEVAKHVLRENERGVPIPLIRPYPLTSESVEAMRAELDDMRVIDTLALSELQLNIDHIKDKLNKLIEKSGVDLDFNNGDEKKTE